MKLSIVFLGLLIFSVTKAEFLFDKNTAAEDKFMCLHKKLYRTEKPIIRSNPARILSLKRVLQSLVVFDPSNPDVINLRNFLCEEGRLGFAHRDSFCLKAVAALYTDQIIGQTIFYRSDIYKLTIGATLNDTFNAASAAGQNVNSFDFLESDTFLQGRFLPLARTRVNAFLNKLGADRQLQIEMDGIERPRLLYVMLNIDDLFVRDTVTALEAFDNYYDSYKTQVLGTPFNSEATVRWIEAIKKRFQEILAIKTPDTQKILEPYYETGITTVETPSGAFTEDVPSVYTPNPTPLEEPEPTTIPPKTANEDLLIKDMLIEIQRTYNVEKMLLTYNQLTSSMKNDIDSCNLSLKGALARCEAIHGTGRCEPISATMVAQKCRAGWIREGCCRCIPSCPDTDFNTKNNAFCEMKTQFYAYPTLLTNNGSSNTAGGCPPGFELNKILCYRSCPSGTVRIGSNTCLKTAVEYLGSPFVWAAGDE
jgi:hypothetical protein